MPGIILPVANQQCLDENGDPYAAGKLYIYVAGGAPALGPPYVENPANYQLTHSDIDQTVAHENPIVLNAAGRVATSGGTAAAIYTEAVTVDVQLVDANNVGIWTIRNVPAAGLSSGGVGVMTYAFGGDPNWEYSNTSYLSGAGLDKILVGSGVWFVDPVLPGTFHLEADIFSPLGGTGTVGLVDLDGGAPDTALTGSEATGGAVAGGRVRSSGITWPTPGVAHGFAVKVRAAAATAPVYVTNARVVQTA